MGRGSHRRRFERHVPHVQHERFHVQRLSDCDYGRPEFGLERVHFPERLAGHTYEYDKCPQPSYSDELYGSYASNDLRKSYWFFKKSSGGNSFSHFLFQAKTSYFTPLSFTLPEAYLIEAEAAAMEDDWTGAAAALKIDS